MKNITEFLKECRVNGNEKIDTNDDSFWKLKDLLEHYKEQCNIPVVSESTFPEEYVMLAKGNYLDKDGSIKEAQTMKDHLGNEYFMVAKDKLYSR